MHSLNCAVFKLPTWEYGSLKTASSAVAELVYSIKDYCSPILCLGAKQRTPFPSEVTFYDTPGNVWAARACPENTHPLLLFSLLLGFKLTAVATHKQLPRRGSRDAALSLTTSLSKLTLQCDVIIV